MGKKNILKPSEISIDKSSRNRDEKSVARRYWENISLTLHLLIPARSLTLPGRRTHAVTSEAEVFSRLIGWLDESKYFLFTCLSVSDQLCRLLCPFFAPEIKLDDLISYIPFYNIPSHLGSIGRLFIHPSNNLSIPAMPEAKPMTQWNWNIPIIIILYIIIRNEPPRANFKMFSTYPIAAWNCWWCYRMMGSPCPPTHYYYSLDGWMAE